MRERIAKLPKWAREHITKLEQRVEQVKKTLPWTEPGMEWFTLFWPGTDKRDRAPLRLFTCSPEGTHLVCTIGPDDWLFVGRGNTTCQPGKETN